MEPLVELREVRVYFEESAGFLRRRVVKALDGVSLTIGDGGVVLVVGESGSGKTTMGRVILGLQKPTSGQALYRGRDIYRLRGKEYAEFRRAVQWVPQDPYSSLDPSLTVREALAAPLRRWGSDDVEGAARRLLELVGLKPPQLFLDKYPHQLSGGQRQRVAIARALATGPRLLVADEPVTMIDASLRISILDVLAELKRKLGMALLFITHDLAIARYLAYRAGGGRAVVMHRGVIVEEGDIESIVKSPGSDYTRQLIESVPDVRRPLKL
ncbi:MAG: ABC transporter ATP-binding protein [Thermoproteus sp. JCHS_4]|jgi:ATPase components of various ABC-type transport systems, contain duplicated ATPase|nr:MAG: ABC transporter ATP-binding protein [Thermoproteus sp. JCHS_4]